MNDETLDELLSAAIDGLASEEELALIAQTPGSSERLNQLRSAADAVSSPLPRIPTEQRQAMIALAVDSFEAPAASEPEVPKEQPKATNVVPLQPRYPRLRSGSAVAGGIAASVIAMGLLASIIGSGLTSDNRDESFSAESAVEQSADMPATTAAPAATTAATAEAIVEEAESPANLGGDGEFDTQADTAVATTAAAEDLSDDAQDVTRLDRTLSCWEAISEQFEGHVFDESFDPSFLDGSLVIPTLDSNENAYLITVDSQTCKFQLLAPRP